MVVLSANDAVVAHLRIATTQRGEHRAVQDDKDVGVNKRYEHCLFN